MKLPRGIKGTNESEEAGKGVQARNRVREYTQHIIHTSKKLFK